MSSWTPRWTTAAWRRTSLRLELRSRASAARAKNGLRDGDRHQSSRCHEPLRRGAGSFGDLQPAAERRSSSKLPAASARPTGASFPSKSPSLAAVPVTPPRSSRSHDQTISGAIAQRLAVLDQRPINNAADATNYTLWEMGHPTHVFDLDLLEGGKMMVRYARDRRDPEDAGRGRAQACAGRSGHCRCT